MCNNSMINLPCKDSNVLKYSVVTGEQSCEFVNVFTTDASNERYITCQSGICQHQYGKKLKYKRYFMNMYLLKLYAETCIVPFKTDKSMVT